MVVVPAGVHDPGFLTVPLRLLRGLEGQVHLLGDRQTVHVRTEADDLSGLAALEHPDHAGARDARLDLEPEAAQVVSDDLRRARFLHPELGVLMEVAAPRDHLRKDFLRRTVDGRGQRIG